MVTTAMARPSGADAPWGAAHRAAPASGRGTAIRFLATTGWPPRLVPTAAERRLGAGPCSGVLTTGERWARDVSRAGPDCGADPTRWSGASPGRQVRRRARAGLLPRRTRRRLVHRPLDGVGTAAVDPATIPT